VFKGIADHVSDSVRKPPFKTNVNGQYGKDRDRNRRNKCQKPKNTGQSKVKA